MGTKRKASFWFLLSVLFLLLYNKALRPQKALWFFCLWMPFHFILRVPCDMTSSFTLRKVLLLDPLSRTELYNSPFDAFHERLKLALNSKF